jgi:hypothetical protein
MPQFTIDVPETIMPLLSERASGWKQSPEDFIVTYLGFALRYDGGLIQEQTNPANEHLEDILEERDKGPFAPVPHDLVERVMEKAMERVRQRQAHV